MLSTKIAISSVLILTQLLFFSCGGGEKDSVSVVTFNMYTGFDAESKLAEFQEGADPAEVATEIFEMFQANIPETRIELAASELATLSPDFICLQEVTVFSVLPLFSTDFLALLTESIREHGGPSYAYISTENIVLSDNIDTGSIIPLSVLYRDREAILYKKQFDLEGKAVAVKLAAHRDAVHYGGEEYVFYRSLLGGRFKYGSENIITLFSTHLDQENLGEVQKNQMAEILELITPYKEDQNLVLVGDFNSEEGEETYELAPAFGLIDSFRSLNPVDEGLTCCNFPDLSNVEPSATQKIDLMFHKSTLWEATESRIILDTRGPIWPSDHFGVLTLFHRLAEDPSS